MFFFVTAVVTSALVSIFMRVSEKHVRNNIAMLAANYAMCTLLAFSYLPGFNPFPASEGATRTALLGAFNGFLYLSGFVALNWNIRQNGMVLSSTFMKLGVLVPTLMAIFFFGESPSALQLVGILAAVAAIVLIHSEKGSSRVKSSLGLLLLPLTGGMADGMSKVYEVYGSAELNSHFLLYTFLVAFVLCILLAISKRQSITVKDVLFGLLIGIPNYFTSRFLLLSLRSIPAIVAYPAYSVGAIVLVTLAGVLFFREKLSRRQVVALMVIMGALALLNL